MPIMQRTLFAYKAAIAFLKSVRKWTLFRENEQVHFRGNR
jgi:hypothetical protein